MMISETSQGQPSPSRWVVDNMHLVSPGCHALDLACGGGRHGRLLHSLGHSVVFLDLDIKGVADMTGLVGCEVIQADLEAGGAWPLPPGEFGLVVVTNYLYRPLFPGILSSLMPGGVLIYETFARGNERFGRPANPDFLLDRGELKELCLEQLDIVRFEDLVVGRPGLARVQRLVARKPDSR